MKGLETYGVLITITGNHLWHIVHWDVGGHTSCASMLASFCLQLAQNLVHAIAHDRLPLVSALAQYLGALLASPLCLCYLTSVLNNASPSLFSPLLLCLLQQHKANCDFLLQDVR